jgi:hypothetical protein
MKQAPSLILIPLKSCQGKIPSTDYGKIVKEEKHSS